MKQNMVVLPTPLERWAMRDLTGSMHKVRRSLCLGKQNLQYAQSEILVSERLFTRRMGSMAIKRHSNKEFTFDRWVNVRLGDSDKENLQELAKSADIGALIDWVASMVYQGYSFSVSWDDWSDSQQLSFVCKAPDDPNYGLGLSARHPEFDMALLTLHYKHTEICAANWNENAPPQAQGWG